MRTLRLAVLLGLAVLAWKLVGGRMPAVKAQIARARERIEPTLRDAAESVRDASLAAAESAESVATAIGEPQPSEPAGVKGSRATSS
jgi:Tfp pilus assembly protein PilX